MWFKFLDCELTFDWGTFFWVEFCSLSVLCSVGLGLDLILISWLRTPLPQEQYKFRLQTVTCSPITLPPTPSWAAPLNQESEVLLFPYVEKGSWVLILIRSVDCILFPLLGHEQYPHVSCGSVSDCAQDQYYAFCSICSCVLIGLFISGSWEFPHLSLSLFFEFECIFKISHGCLLFSISVGLLHGFMCVDPLPLPVKVPKP